MEHVPTGKYLSILPSNNNCPSLEEQFQSDASIFGVYVRGGGSGGGQQRQQQYHGDEKSNTNQHHQHCKNNTIIGFKNKCANKWLGQTLFGSVACSATKFGKREEWEVSVMQEYMFICVISSLIVMQLTLNDFIFCSSLHFALMQDII